MLQTTNISSLHNLFWFLYISLAAPHRTATVLLAWHTCLLFVPTFRIYFIIFKCFTNVLITGIVSLNTRKNLCTGASGKVAHVHTFRTKLKLLTQLYISNFGNESGVGSSFAELFRMNVFIKSNEQLLFESWVPVCFRIDLHRNTQTSFIQNASIIPSFTHCNALMKVCISHISRKWLTIQTIKVLMAKRRTLSSEIRGKSYFCTKKLPTSHFRWQQFSYIIYRGIKNKW